MVYIKELLLLIEKSSLCGGSGFPLSLSEWSFTICLTQYNCKQNVLSASLNKIFPSFLPILNTSVSISSETYPNCHVQRVDNVTVMLQTYIHLF